LLPTISPGDDEGNEVGFLQLFNNGVSVSPSNFTFTRLNAPPAPKPLALSSDGVTFIADRTDGSFQFKIEANPLSGLTFNELRFSTKPYDNPTKTYEAAPFKEDSSDYLVRNIEYQGTEDPISLQFSAPTFSVNEDGTPIAAVTVTRIGSSVGTASATVNLTNASATAPSDYNNAPISVNFANGDTAAKTITIPIVDDTLVEGDETVNLSLGSPTGNASIGTQNTATLSIVDDDSSLQFSAPTFSVNEDGTAIAAVTVTRTARATGAVSAAVNLTDGTATAGVDYDGTPIVVNFADGDSAPQTVAIPIFNDTLVEGDETVNLSLGSPTGNASIGTQNTAATLSIVDDDPPSAPLAKLSAASLVGDSITGFSLASAIDSNKVSNVAQNGIPLQGGSTNIDNNDITNANTSDALTWGGIPVQDSSLFAGSALQTVDMLSNFITNFLNPVPGTSGIGAPKVKINYIDIHPVLKERGFLIVTD
jgi:hypothetical protein